MSRGGSAYCAFGKAFQILWGVEPKFWQVFASVIQTSKRIVRAACAVPKDEIPLSFFAGNPRHFPPRFPRQSVRIVSAAFPSYAFCRLPSNGIAILREAAASTQYRPKFARRIFISSGNFFRENQNAFGTWRGSRKVPRAARILFGRLKNPFRKLKKFATQA